MKRDAVITGLAFLVFFVLLILTAGCSETGEMACDALEGRDRDHCLQALAKTTGDLSLCNKIENAGPASKCYVYVAEQNGNANRCILMLDQPWYHDSEAYSAWDCVMYVARNTNSPGVCDSIPADVQGDATDLNPYMVVSAKRCREIIQCGSSGLPACRASDGPILKDIGHPQAFYCKEEGMSTYYSVATSC